MTRSLAVPGIETLILSRIRPLLGPRFETSFHDLEHGPTTVVGNQDELEQKGMHSEERGRPFHLVLWKSGVRRSVPGAKSPIPASYTWPTGGILFYGGWSGCLHRQGVPDSCAPGTTSRLEHALSWIRHGTGQNQRNNAGEESTTQGRRLWDKIE